MIGYCNRMSTIFVVIWDTTLSLSITILLLCITGQIVFKNIYLLMDKFYFLELWFIATTGLTFNVGTLFQLQENNAHQ